MNEWLGFIGALATSGRNRIPVRINRDPNGTFVVALRKKLVQDGTLAEKDGFLVFAKDTEFDSPSAAAAVIHGGGANGLTAWKDSTGKSLKELEVG